MIDSSFPSSSSIEAPFFQNASCDPFTAETEPCTLGNYVEYAINVSSAADVATGIKFAKEKNIRVVIKNTGHEYVHSIRLRISIVRLRLTYTSLLGKSTGKGALGIWTHNLKSVNFINYESPSYNGPAIKMGAGVQAYDAYYAASEQGLRVLGGTCPTVGLAGGYTQGGGHSTLSSTYGLAADNALEWEVITATGEHIVAAETQNQELYWALSGGGAGTFGVVLSLTARAFADGEIGGASLLFSPEGTSSAAFWAAVGLFHESIPGYVDIGGTVDYELSSTGFEVNVLNFPGKTSAEVSAIVQPLTDSLNMLGVNYTLNVTSFPNFLQHFNHYFGPLPYSVDASAQVSGSRLIPRSVVQQNNQALTAALQELTSTGKFLIAGLGISAPLNLSSNTPASNAVLPAWRSTLLHLLVVAEWNFTAPLSENLALQAQLTNVIVPSLEAITPRSGAYLNEANFQQPNFQEAFYGANYPKLLEVKKKWDPDSLFYATTAVGSEVYEVASDGRLCRVI